MTTTLGLLSLLLDLSTPGLGASSISLSGTTIHVFGLDPESSSIKPAVAVAAVDASMGWTLMGVGVTCAGMSLTGGVNGTI